MQILWENPFVIEESTSAPLSSVNVIRLFRADNMGAADG